MSRWKWIRRPKWLIVLAIAAAFLGWLFWPITVYEVVGRTRGYSITLPGSSERTPRSISVMPYHEGPWTTRNRLEESAAAALSAEAVPGLGDRAFWIRDRHRTKKTERRQLAWVRGNINLTLRVDGEFEDTDPWTPQWIAACEREARETDAAFLKGKCGTKTIRPHYIPRVILWTREQIDIRRRKAGVRTEGWWKDW